MPAEPSPRRLHLWTALILVSVFAAGAATGAGLAWALRPQGRPGGPRLLTDGMPPIVAELGLSPEQAARARAIFESHRAELEAAVQETFPRVRAVQDQVDREIRAILTPEQVARFDELRTRRPPMRGMGGPPHPHPPPPPQPR